MNAQGVAAVGLMVSVTEGHYGLSFPNQKGLSPQLHHGIKKKLVNVPGVKLELGGKNPNRGHTLVLVHPASIFPF